MNSFSQTFCLLILFLVFSNPVSNNAQTDSFPNRLYFGIQGVKLSGTEYPSRFDAYKSSIDQNVKSYTNNFFTVPDGKFGFGTLVGYQWREQVIVWGVEAEYFQSSYADGEEQLEEVIWNGVFLPSNQYSYKYNQTERRNSALTGNAMIGFFPFEDFQLGFYASIGFGIGWQSLKSAATDFADKRGYDVKETLNDTDYDLGEYDGNGVYSRSSLVYLLGGGAEFFVSAGISLKLDYKYVASSYTRENVLISGGGGGVPNVYQKEKMFEYTFAHKLSLGVFYYFE